MAYTTNRSGSWVKTTLDGNTSGGWGVNFVDIMLDEGDDPHVVYSDIVGKKILYMSNTRGVWERILVAGDSISWLSSATMDQNGGIRVSYYIEGSDKDLGYAAVRSLALFQRSKSNLICRLDSHLMLILVRSRERLHNC